MSDLVVWACMDENNQFKEFYMATTPKSDRDIKGPADLHIPDAIWTGTEIVRNEQRHVDYHMQVLRNRRNMLLNESDWTMNAPLPESKKIEWEVYRQALRDLPLNVTYPIWPEFPNPPS
jgi:hypothetical protein